MGNMFSQFTTNKNAEVDGIYLDFGDFRIKCRRAGGSNKLYEKILAEVTGPYMRALKLGTIDNDKAKELMYTVFARAVIIGWEYPDGENEDKSTIWASGVQDPVSNEVVPLSEEVVISIFRHYPDLFAAVQEEVTSIRNFRTEDDKAAVKN